VAPLVAHWVAVIDMAEAVSLTYRELAHRLGITINSARIKARRRKWLVLPGNHPLDPARVEVPSEFLSRVAPCDVGDSGATGPSPGDGDAEMADAISVIGDDRPVTGGATVPLSQALEMVTAERDRADRRLAEAIAQEREKTAIRLAERDTLHLGHVERLLAQASLERALWLERIDAAEIRAERVEQRLDQVLDQLLTQWRQPASRVEISERAPWWRRVFGASKRTYLGRNSGE
jgi:hypothetical protein